MKKKIYNTLKILVIFLLMGTGFTVFAQGPPPPPSSETNNSGNALNGGGAPIGGGLFILLGLGAAYGGRKLYQMKKESLEE